MVRAVLGLLSILLAVQAAAVPRPAVRFHHFHFRAGDPAAAINLGAASLNASRVLLRGLGVGVRADDAYALFDRLDANPANPPASTGAEGAYATARDWLVGSGVDVTAANAQTRQRLSRAFAAAPIDHVAFTAPDMDAVVAALEAHGARAARRTDAAVWFAIAGGRQIEIVRDLDRPDAFWCPMHPDVRAADAVKCPRCGMTLVPIPPLRVGEYRMDVAVAPQPGGRGASKLRLTLRDPDGRGPVDQLSPVHERLLHLFIIDRRLEFFRHIHPLPASGGAFEIVENLPPGAYVAIADFMPAAGRPQMLHHAIATPGYRGPLFPDASRLTADDTEEKQVDGIRVSLAASSLKAGKEAMLRFTLSDAASRRPIDDLEPFLGAAGHMLIVSADLTAADHAHPDDPATRGPSITFQPLMPAGGLYKLWLQVQRRGRVVTIPFVVAVSGA